MDSSSSAANLVSVGRPANDERNGKTPLAFGRAIPYKDKRQPPQNLDIGADGPRNSPRPAGSKDGLPPRARALFLPRFPELGTSAAVEGLRAAKDMDNWSQG